MMLSTLIKLSVKTLADKKLSVFLFHKVPHKTDPLMPHDMNLKDFIQMLDRVVSVFNVISLDDAISGLTQGLLPPRAACITFDDGYASWLTGVVPALEERGLHATFFITTGQFDGRPLWHERIAQAVGGAEGSAIKLAHPACPLLSIRNLSERTSAILYLENFLKYLTLPAREDLLLNLETIAGVKKANVQIMSIADLKAIHSRGFDIGGHTDNHPILSYCDSNDIQREVGASRETLSALINAPVRSFAYPNGHPNADFSSAHIIAVKKSGYQSAVTTQWGVAGTGTSVFQIPRFTPWGKNLLNIASQLGRNFFTTPVLLQE